MTNMRILILEDNLFWSSRLRLSVVALGHEPVVLERMPPAWPDAELAIVNLGSVELAPPLVVPALRERGIRVIGHAGHKEGALLDLGRAAGCHLIVSNGTLTHRLEQVIQQALLLDMLGESPPLVLE
jgi:hypothetical protein